MTQDTKVLVFRQKNNIPMTVLSIVLFLVLTPVIGSMAMMPQVISLVPAVLLAMLSFVGPVSMIACSGILVLLAYTLFGGWGVLCAALLVAPTIVFSVVAVERREPFWISAAGACVTMFVSIFAIMALLTFLAGDDIITAMSAMLTEMMESYGFLGDMLLTLFIQTGAIAAPEGYDAAVGVASIDPQVRREILQTLVLLMDTVMRLEIPMQMATGSIAAGLLGHAALRKGLRRRGVAVDYPPLRTWRVPKGWGRILGGTLLLLLVLSRMLPQQMNSMFYVFSGVFDQVFALQGIASICYLLHTRGKGAFLKGLVFAAGYLLLRQFAVMLGILDQAMDFTHRRERLSETENPFDPRAGE